MRSNSLDLKVNLSGGPKGCTWLQREYGSAPPNLNDKYLWGGGGANLFFIPRLGSYIFATFDHTEFVAYRSSFQQNFAIGARANAYL